MKYVEQLLSNERYQSLTNQLELLERERIFCKHGFEHGLDVARIAYIMNLEMSLGQEKEEIYLSALLHDIGRIQEYQNGTDHQEASVQIAEELLEEIDYPKEKREPVLKRVREHRHLSLEQQEITVDNFFWFADKKARNCFLCKQQKDCNWAKSKRTGTIKW